MLFLYFYSVPKESAMKINYKKSWKLIVLTLLMGSAYAQEPSDYISKGVVNDALLVRDVMELNYPGYQNVVDDVFEASKTFSNKSGGVLEVNLVVHVVWNSSFPEENIDDSVILNQVAILNEDFARLNADTVNLRSIFLPVAGNPHIQFNLVDIVRVETQETFSVSLTGLPDQVKQVVNGGSDAYNTGNYLNIWVCKIQPFFGSSLFGYAYPPAGLPHWPADSEAPSPELDGVVLDFRTIGSNNPTPYPDPNGGTIDFLGRTAVHEVGHFLGLRHTWGDGGGLFGGGDSCGEDDGCLDTPNQGAQSNFDCDVAQNTCIDSVAGQPDPNDLPDLIENYMDYSSETCSNMFTMEQVIIMRNVLENERVGLLSDVTGVENVALQEFVVFPNPAKENIVIHFINKESNTMEVSFYDVYGKLVWSKTGVFGEDLSIDLVSFSSGVYFVEVVEGASRLTKKVIVNK